MSFYLRKSIKAGPFRFNFSKSGIGVSTGIKGLRVGTGPRGNYVHMGRGGIYYRKTLKDDSPSSAPSNSSNSHSTVSPQESHIDAGHGEFKEIDSGDVSAMTDSSSSELLAEFDAKRKKITMYPFILACTLLLLWWLPTEIPFWGRLLILTFGALLTYLAYNYDQIRKSVVLFYELDGQYEAAYQALHEAFERLTEAKKTWHIEAQADVYDAKRNAGASQVIKRQVTELSVSSAPYVKTNISTPSIKVGKQTLYFFPDRLLVFEKNKVGAVSYSDLDVEVSATQFIESDGVPEDAEVVGRTWKYVNKSGGPDKRFSNNQEMPICFYETLHFRSVTGLNELIHLSKRGNGFKFKFGVEGFAKALPPQ